MLSILSICAALVAAVAAFKLFFSSSDKKGASKPTESNITTFAPWWFMIVRHLFQKKVCSSSVFLFDTDVFYSRLGFSVLFFQTTDDVMKEIGEKYGPVAYVRLGFQKKVFVSDAELCRRVLGNVDEYQKAVFFSPRSAIAKFSQHTLSV